MFIGFNGLIVKFTVLEVWTESNNRETDWTFAEEDDGVFGDTATDAS